MRPACAGLAMGVLGVLSLALVAAMALGLSQLVVWLLVALGVGQ